MRSVFLQKSQVVHFEDEDNIPPDKAWNMKHLVFIMVLSVVVTGVVTVIVMAGTGFSNVLRDKETPPRIVHDNDATNGSEKKNEHPKQSMGDLWKSQETELRNHEERPSKTVVHVVDLFDDDDPIKPLVFRDQDVMLRRCKSSSCYCRSGKCTPDPSAPKTTKEIVVWKYKNYGSFESETFRMDATEDTACICI